ncbi:MAG: 3-dehydro-L-gulonate 2-dehydrogenase [Spirochaetaceae bacterium]|jgi:3-dehydro-L-gulonate 2-dehydrogenase|nr:3-dehydro-L-gulonate 2-dehydrogenase [Spirochaetaceae bacterium]
MEVPKIDIRISYDTMKGEFKRVFLKCGMDLEKSEVCAKIHTESSLDGVYSHGANRVARFFNFVQKGWVDVKAEPSLEKSFGAVEVWNGNRGPGILNALFATDRGIALAEKHGIGLVGLKNTTHWMRGGTYGKYAAEKGYVAVCWTNTESVMPPWGGREVRLGNNPFVMAAPSEEGPVILDMAMSLYSYGKLQVTGLAGKKLPFPGGWDKEGNLTDDPRALSESLRLLPIGYWKGSSFSFMLDILAAILSDGLCAAELDNIESGNCTGCSQIFILIDPEKIGGREYSGKVIRIAKEHIKSSAPAEHGGRIQYPGEGSARSRADNLKNGIPVDEGVWERICGL